MEPTSNQDVRRSFERSRGQVASAPRSSYSQNRSQQHSRRHHSSDITHSSDALEGFTSASSTMSHDTKSTEALTAASTTTINTDRTRRADRHPEGQVNQSSLEHVGSWQWANGPPAYRSTISVDDLDRHPRRRASHDRPDTNTALHPLHRPWSAQRVGVTVYPYPYPDRHPNPTQRMYEQGMEDEPWNNVASVERPLNQQGTPGGQVVTFSQRPSIHPSLKRETFHEPNSRGDV